MAIASQAEQQINTAMEHFDNMSRDDMLEMRQKRRAQLEERAKMMDEWRAQGHGKYEEIADEKQWFEEAKTNKHLITHFYRSTTAACQVLDMHLARLAPKHMETRFIKIDAEKCAYLVEKLNIRVMPTLIMTEDNFTADRLEGFTELGNTDKFTTVQLAERLGKRGMIEYEAVPAGSAEAVALMEGGKLTANAANKTGKAVYESARARFMADLEDGDDDDFLKTSDDEAEAGDGAKPASAEAAAASAAAAEPVVSTATAVGEDADIKIW